MVGDSDGGLERAPEQQRGVAGHHQHPFATLQAVADPDRLDVGHGADPQERQGGNAGAGGDNGGQRWDAPSADEWDPARNDFSPALDETQGEQG